MPLGKTATSIERRNANKERAERDRCHEVEALCRVAVRLCSADAEALREAFNLALDFGVPRVHLREVILTSYLFDGYPAALEGFRVLSALTGGDCSGDRIGYSAAELSIYRNRGEKLCRLIYASQYEKLIHHVEEFAPELAESMIVEGYGKVLARPALDVLPRELCVVSILAFKGRSRQLMSHCLGALRLGASRRELEVAVRAGKAGGSGEMNEQVMQEAFAKLNAP